METPWIDPTEDCVFQLRSIGWSNDENWFLRSFEALNRPWLVPAVQKTKILWVSMIIGGCPAGWFLSKVLLKLRRSNRPARDISLTPSIFRMIPQHTQEKRAFQPQTMMFWEEIDQLDHEQWATHGISQPVVVSHEISRTNYPWKQI